MKNTKQNVIALLEKMIKNAYNVQKIFEERGNKETAEYYKGKRNGLEMAIYLLKDTGFFQEEMKIFEDIKN